MPKKSFSQEAIMFGLEETLIAMKEAGITDEQFDKINKVIERRFMERLEAK